jgi:hypothetical protein
VLWGYYLMGNEGKKGRSSACTFHYRVHICTVQIHSRQRERETQRQKSLRGIHLKHFYHTSFFLMDMFQNIRLKLRSLKLLDNFILIESREISFQLAAFRNLFTFTSRSKKLIQISATFLAYQLYIEYFTLNIKKGLKLFE